ncbi:MAG: tetratricopeptide repeat protein [Anaeromyxobacteraceae bacterium]|nr:tetratricopeptide repeat protein [Anaeromyxobacteraceae bacterium]
MPLNPRRAAPRAAALLACAPSPLVHPRAAEELRRGYHHLAAGDAERAEVAFGHALEFAPDLPEGWNGLGVVARARGELGSARRAFTRAARLAPAFAEGHANLGEVLLAEGRPDDAAEALRAALRIDPDLAAPRLNLARALLQQGLLEPGARAARWAEARHEYLHLLEAAPGSAAAEADLAFMAYLDGRAEEAAARWARAAALEETPAVRLGECLALAALGRCAAAAPACDRCLALAPAAEGCRAARRGLEECPAGR